MSRQETIFLRRSWLHGWGLSQGGLVMLEQVLEIIYAATIIGFLFCGIIATTPPRHGH